jgi:Rod binding domain-containing protein
MMEIGIEPVAAARPAAVAATDRTATNDQTAGATAQAFEAVFLGQITQMMLETAQAGGDAPCGRGEEIFRSVPAEKLDVEIARRGGVGLAPALLQQIIRMQGNLSNGQ